MGVGVLSRSTASANQQPAHGTWPDSVLALAEYVRERTGAKQVRVLAHHRLSGGAIQNNDALTLACTGGQRPGRHELVVRSDAPSGVDASMTRAQEFQVLQCAFHAGVTVPEPLWLCEDDAVMGRAFCVMARVKGTAHARTLVRADMEPGQARSLVRQLGVELARIHSVKPPLQALDFLQMPTGSAALARVHTCRALLARVPEPHPVLEWALNWLEDCAPDGGELTLCHGDFRTGNYMVHEGRITGVLDWEFARWSDPIEDLGWLCARCWRFGAFDKPVGGLGYKADLFEAYTQASGRAPNPDQVLYWEAMASVGWAVIALQQAQRHLSGEQPSLELALTGRIVPEMELDLLHYMAMLGGAH